MKGFEGCSDREILVIAVTKLDSLMYQFNEFKEEQRRCNDKHDDAINEIQVKGSNEAQEAITKAKELAVEQQKLTDRVVKVEKTCLTTDTSILAGKTWTDSVYVKIGIISGVALGVIGFIFDIIRYKGGP